MSLENPFASALSHSAVLRNCDLLNAVRINSRRDDRPLRDCRDTECDQECIFRVPDLSERNKKKFIESFALVALPLHTRR